MKEVLSFLADLKENNHKDWMDANKPRYKASREAFLSLVTEVIDGISLFDPTIVGTEAKNCIFRLNRDIRFSKDKSPYKTNFGASISAGGKKSPDAGYYVHIMPGNNFIGGGMYMPEAATLKKVRQEIDYNTDDFLKIIEDKNFLKVFGSIQGDALKTAPKGYPKDHPHIDLLKRKSFFFLHEISDAEIKQAGLTNTIAQKFELLFPFIQFMNASLD